MRSERVHANRNRLGPAAFAGAVVISSAALLAACAGRSSESLEEARSAVAAARADPEVVAQAPEPLAEAEQALDRAESAFGAGAVAVRVNAAGQGDFFQVHVDATKADLNEVKEFLRRAFYRRFKMCRLCLRDLARKGQIPGLIKASW